MIQDSQTRVYDSTAVSASGVSPFNIDLLSPDQAHIDNGTPIALVINIVVAADHTTGDETYAFNIIQSANQDSSAADVLSTVAIAAANTAAKLGTGARIIMPVPPGSITKRYLGASVTLGGTTPSITITAEFQPLAMVQNEVLYKDNVTID